MFLTEDLFCFSVKFTWKKNEQVADWKDVQTLYELDVGDYDTRMLNKLTDAHVYKEKMKKMKVKLAAQVFSQRVSSVMRGLAKFGELIVLSHGTFQNRFCILGNGCLSDSAEDTADFLLFGDKLFDSVNGSTVLPPHSKTLRCAVTATSSHITFWYEAIKVLQSMKFFSDNKPEFIPPTVKNWITPPRD